VVQPSFNLVDEPWLPVRAHGEPGVREVSLREALARAPDFVELSHPSPVVTVSLYRLALAVLHAAHRGPATHDSRKAMWEAGAFDPTVLDRYLGEVGHRFDLFDPVRPFYQVPDLPTSAATSIAKLGHAYSAGNNPVHFDHTWDDAPPALPAAEAARLLVTQQTFAIGGLIARLPGEPPSAEAGHLVKGAVCLATGNNLFETLMLNLVVMNGAESRPFEFDQRQDGPAWDAELPTAGPRQLRGYLDLLTWQSRRVRLLPDEGGDTVSRAVIMAGNRFTQQANLEGRETMVAYRRRKTAKDTEPFAPVGFRPEQALWRDSHALVQDSETSTRPLVLASLKGMLDRRRVVGLSAFGLSTDRAKVFLWRREDLPLPLAYLEDESKTLVEELRGAVGAAEDAAGALRRSVWTMAELALAPDANADRARVTQLTESLAPERAYWPRLDLPFRKFIVDLPLGDGEAAKREWASEIQNAATAAFDRCASALATSSRGYRAAAEARQRFRWTLRKALADHQLDFEPEPTLEEVH
jgi:CRISPR system Cascade subunit CasA